MIAILNFGSKKTPLIYEQVSRFASAELIDFSEVASFDFVQYEAFILSGAPILITKDNIQKELTFVQQLLDLGKPILGICFGHQLIGLCNGALAFLQEEDRAMTQIELIAEHHFITQGFSKHVEMAEDHCERISLPADFQLIGYSKKCSNEWMVHVSKPIIGVQFHPETSGEAGEKLFRNFIAYVERSKA